jgi:hypothetical protein
LGRIVPTLKVYLHGLTAGIAPSVNTHQRAKRGDCGGWSSASTRSNNRFLYSVEPSGLEGVAYVLTLTVRDCPPAHGDWKRLREAFFERLRRLGMVRCHWVTEWQRRGVPHLHMAAWFPSRVDNLQEQWMAVARCYGAMRLGQRVVNLTDAVGWFQYVSKHAARGVSHYQRSPENIPQGWQKTGRMWGYRGEWPLRPAMQFGLDREGYFAFRRLVRAWRKADSRQPVMTAKSVARLRSARRMLRCHDRTLSEVRGVSEWIGQDLALAFLLSLGGRGYRIQQTG